VAIPAFNAERFLGEALDSVAAQTYRDLETIVVDDGSTDGTAGVAASRPGVRLHHRARGGPAAARNAAISEGTGELIALLDADDVWQPSKLEEQVARLDGRPDLLLVSTWVDGRSPARAGALLEGRVTRRLVERNDLTTSTVVFRRAAFLAAGGFDEDPRLISVEDYDLWLRLSVLGPFGQVGRPLALRRRHGANLSRDALRLNRRTLRVIEKFERQPAAAEHGRAIARRKAELLYLIGRQRLGRGHSAGARAALRRSREADPGHALGCLALELASRLPRSWLLAIHDARERRRDRAGRDPHRLRNQSR
jgi:glycosyltransferase involved in cell wall biosynthesis